MIMDFEFSHKKLIAHIIKETIIPDIVVILGILICKISINMAHSGTPIEQLVGKSGSLIIICAMFMSFILGFLGFCQGITIWRQTYKAQLQIENNTLTFMRVSNYPFIVGSIQVGMQAWHMDEVTEIEERMNYYIIKGKGIHVEDTRIMSDQKEITKFKLPKWFSDMDKIRNVLKYKK